MTGHQGAPGLFEHTDVDSRGVVIFLVSLLASLVLVLALMWGLWRVLAWTRASEGPFPQPQASQLPPAPRIQANPPLDLWRLRAHEGAVLDTYGWVDQQAGVLRIPIGRAMDLVAQRGLPVRTETGAAPTAPETGPESGGPQTGQPMPRVTPVPEKR
jgi:hypothetical protein